MPTPTLLTIDDASLLSILLHLSLETFSPLQHTCRHFHAFLRNPHNVIPLLKSPSHKHPIIPLTRFPRWSLNADVLKAVLAAPKPPHLYLERYLEALVRMEGVAKVLLQVWGEAIDWYPEMSPILELVFKSSPYCRSFSSIHRVLSARDPVAVLQLLVDEESFPLEELFRELENASTNFPMPPIPHAHANETLLLQSAWLRSNIKLRDILPRVYHYLSLHPSFPPYDFMIAMYNGASPSEKGDFETHITPYLNNLVTPTVVFLNLASMFPHLVMPTAQPQPFEHRHIRHAIHTSDLVALRNWVARGFILSHETVLTMWTTILKFCFLRTTPPNNHLTNWCFLVGYLIKRGSETTTSEWHHSHPNNDLLMTRALFEAAKSDLFQFSPASSQHNLPVLLQCITEGIIDWKASEHVLDELGQLGASLPDEIQPRYLIKGMRTIELALGLSEEG
ncbi:hypothetical protein HK097_005669, partial [Rhizophlyctis rosea]